MSSHLRPIDLWFIAQVLPHEAHFLAAARRLTGDPEVARDLVQEAFARLFTVDGWSAITAPRGYVMRMIRNMAIERLRRARIVRFEQLTAIEAFDVADDAPSAFRVRAARDEMRRVEAAVLTLPERCRDVVTLRRFEDHAPRDIARQLGVSLSTLEKRLARGLHLLALALRPEVDDSAPARVEAEVAVKASKR